MTMDDEIYERIQKLCNLGDEATDEGDFDSALVKYKEALELVPTPKTDWEASTWIYASIGDTYFILGDFEKAKDAFYDAYNCPDGETNPFIMLRLGQSLLECDNLEKAREYLLRAYMLEGQDIFEEEEEKYLDSIQDLIRQPN